MLESSSRGLGKTATSISARGWVLLLPGRLTEARVVEKHLQAVAARLLAVTPLVVPEYA